MAGAQPKTSCTSIFKKLEIIPVPCQCTFLLMKFITNKQDIKKIVYTTLIKE
jgi:hypothetical protein